MSASDDYFGLNSVSVDFGGVRALDQVTVQIPRGQICGLVGPNGSGKTTLLGVVSGLVAPSAGRVHLSGRALRPAHPAEAALAGVARTFQNLRLAADQTALENVMTGAGLTLRRKGVRGLFAGRAEHARIRARAEAALARVGIADAAARRPTELPYGHRRRVEIARAVAMEPSLLLLDEPAAGMTAGERRDLGEVITGLAADGITQVLVEHDFAMIGRLCSRALVLSSGRLIADDAPHRVAEMPTVQEAYLGTGRQVRAHA